MASQMPNIFREDPPSSNHILPNRIQSRLHVLRSGNFISCFAAKTGHFCLFLLMHLQVWTIFKSRISVNRFFRFTSCQKKQLWHDCRSRSSATLENLEEDLPIDTTVSGFKKFVSYAPRECGFKGFRSVQVVLNLSFYLSHCRLLALSPFPI